MADDEPGPTADRLRRQEIDEIGRAVKLARNARGWSLRRLASDAGVSASLVSAIETGKIVPTVGSLFAISDALDEPAQHFFPARRRLPASASVGEADDGDIPAAETPSPATTQTSAPAVRSVDGSRRFPVPEFSGTERDDVMASTTVVDPIRKTTQLARPDRTTPEAVVRAEEATVLARPLLRRPVRHAQGRRVSLGRRSVSSRQSGAPTPGDPSGTGRAASLTADGDASADPGQSDAATPRAASTPGVATLRAGERPVIRLETGQTWSLPFPRAEPIGQVIEVSIPAATAAPSLHRVREDDVTVLVLSGRLVVEAAFARTVLDCGDTATIGSGVPYRLQGDEKAETRFLVAVSGDWDGRV